MILSRRLCCMSSFRTTRPLVPSHPLEWTCTVHINIWKNGSPVDAKSLVIRNVSAESTNVCKEKIRAICEEAGVVTFLSSEMTDMSFAERVLEAKSKDSMSLSIFLSDILCIPQKVPTGVPIRVPAGVFSHWRGRKKKTASPQTLIQDLYNQWRGQDQ